MKHLTLALLTTSSIATGAVAGSTPQPGVADWSGYYAGASYSFDTADFAAFNPVGTPLFTNTHEGSLYGGFAGYNFQRGNLVFGGEVAYSIGDITGAPTGILGATIDQMLDLKARAGYTFGSALVYGVAGGSFGHYSDQTVNIDFSGFNYGLGLEYKFNDHFFAGVEYLIRDVSGDTDVLLGSYGEIDIRSIQIRAGWVF